MNELSLYILDLAQNSLSAGAKNVRIVVSFQPDRDRITIVIEDDGCGMDEALLACVTSPFVTTRKTRSVGLGIPMARQVCEMCEGAFALESRAGVGTRLTMSLRASHIDRPPMGRLAETLYTLIAASGETTDFFLRCAYGAQAFEFSTAEIRRTLGSAVPLNTPEVLGWIHDCLRKGIEETAPLNHQ